MPKKKEDEEKAVLLEDLADGFNKKMGARTVFRATALPKDPPRLPVGVFPIDYAIGGGLPMWGSTCFWGAEQGGKSSLCANVLAMATKVCWNCFKLADRCECSTPALRMKGVWLDVEGTLDRHWNECIGVDSKMYHIVHADYGEQYANVAHAVLQADDVGIVIIDSLGALMPDAEMEAGAEDQFYAIQTKLITRMTRKLKQTLIRQRKIDKPCLVLFTNQLRMKIGMPNPKMNPETMSGGHAMKHEFSLLLRCVKKSLNREGVDSKYVDSSRKKDMANRHAVAIRKKKILTITGAVEYVRAEEAMPELDLKKGEVDDYNTVMSYAKDFMIVKKVGNKWEVGGKKASKLASIKTYWKKNRDEYLKSQHAIIEAAKVGLMPEEPEIVVDPDGG